MLWGGSLVFTEQMLFLPLVEIKVVREDSASWKLTSLVVVSHHIWPLTQISMTSACATSVSLFTFALFLLDTILTPWRGVIQKSIARMQAHFSLLDVGSAGKIIFLEFAPVSLLAGYRGVFLGFMVRVCHPVLQIMTLFQTTKLSFSTPVLRPRL